MIKNIFKKEIIDYYFCLNLKEKDYPKYLMKIFKQNMGYTFNLKKPKTINEKIQYLKLYDNIDLKGVLTDKSRAGKWVNLFIDKKYIKEIYGIYDSILDVDFSKLHKRYMIKKNNGCKHNVVILNNDLFNKEAQQKVVEYFIERENLNCAFLSGFELQYKNIKPKIIVERLYPKTKEYRILFSKGRAILLQVDNQMTNVCYQMHEISPEGKVIGEVENPDKIDELFELAYKLCGDFKLVRIDFMLVDNRFWFFQEMTFTPYSGFCLLNEYNSEKLGERVDIS